MRDIIFRGKRLDNGEWVEGDYFRKYIYDRDGNVSLHHLIGWQVADNDGEMCNDYEDVDPATVGQYTGKKDKNGKKIFEGDIIHTKQYGKDEYGLNHCGYDIFSVRFINSSFRIESNNRWFYLTDGHHIEVIGNIHDTPDLLK